MQVFGARDPGVARSTLMPIANGLKPVRGRRKMGRPSRILIISLLIAVLSLVIESVNIASAEQSANIASITTSSRDVTIPAKGSVTLGVPCDPLDPSCAPAVFHSAKVTISVVVQSFASSQSGVVMSFFFGNPAKPGCPSFTVTCPRKDFGALPTFVQGPSIREYDGYATIISNNGTSPATVSWSWSGVSPAPP